MRRVAPDFMSDSFLANLDDSALLQLGICARELGYNFTTVTPATHARVNARPQNARARDLVGVLGWSRAFSPEILPPEVWEWMQKARVVAPYDNGFRSLVRLSTLDNCLFFHSAFPTTEADSVFFGPDTYRFGVALTQHFANSSKPVKRAVDIGCGAGPGAILSAKQFPDAQIYGADINETALRFSRVNALLNQTANFEAKNSNLLGAFEGNFDLIVSNPPYLIDPAQRAYRHGGGPLGAGLSLRILESALERLNPSGTLILYTGAAMLDGCDPFLQEVEARLKSFAGNWNLREMDVDIFGEELETAAYSECDRIAAVVLTVERD